MKTLTSIINTLSTIFIQSPSTIESATLAHKVMFGLYVLSLLFTLVLTVLLWRASNKAQDVVTADAEVKIASARAEASRANEGIKNAELKIAEVNLSAEEAKENAAKATVETEKITKENIELRSHLENAISDATIEKQKLAKMQIEVASAKRQQAEAEQSLEQLRQRIRPRLLTEDQQTRLANSIKSSKGKIDIVCMLGDAESYTFASQINAVLKSVGWQTNDVSQAVFTGNPVGLILKVHSAETAPSYAILLQQAFSFIGFTANGAIAPDIPEHTLTLIVGTKP